MELIVLLLVIALAVLILGGIYWLAARFFPDPVPLIIVGVIALIILIAIASGSSDIDVGNGR